MFLTLSDPVDGDGVGDLHHGVEDCGDQPQEEGDQHREARRSLDHGLALKYSQYSWLD